MTIAAYGHFTARGIARIAAQRAARIEAERQALLSKSAPVRLPEPGNVLRFRPSKQAHMPMHILSAHEISRIRHMAFLASLQIVDRSSAKEIINRVAEFHDMTAGDILDKSRIEKIVTARFDAIVAVRLAYPEKSLPWLGRLFNRDHTSILHSLRKRGLK